jgi:uncharacterized protein YecE (DUF72 family)
MTDIYIGTSGWAYDWNLGKSLEWYATESGLNAIELNMSFYRFPYSNMIKSWVIKGSNLRWIIKLHRSITHFKKLNEESYSIYKKFKELFTPLEDKIHYYLLQLPPKFTDIEKLDKFIEECGYEKLSIEFREPSMFSDKIIRWSKQKGILLVSIDAPKMPYKILSKSIIYLRIHGRTDWYRHDYSEKELFEIKERILLKKPDIVYVFFNNNHAMLRNARTLYRLFKI